MVKGALFGCSSTCSENEVKNRWYSAVIRKRLALQTQGDSSSGHKTISSNSAGQKRRNSASTHGDLAVKPNNFDNASSPPHSTSSAATLPPMSSDDQLSLRVAEVFLRSTLRVHTARNAPHGQWSGKLTGEGAVLLAVKRSGSLESVR